MVVCWLYDFFYRSDIKEVIKRELGYIAALDCMIQVYTVTFEAIYWQYSRLLLIRKVKDQMRRLQTKAVHYFSYQFFSTQNAYLAKACYT